jgi:polyprenyl-phospho-N-acetylgalactosaminyl synthase
MTEFGQNSTIWVVIAAHNEETAIVQVVRRLAACGYRILVVDDGSDDSTLEAAIASGATALRHPINLGQGAALQTGIEYAIAAGAEIIATFDADGQHRAGDIAVLVNALVREQADFALGSRFLGQTVRLPIMRRLMLRAATLFTRLVTGLRLTDTHNGLRAMTRRGAASIRLRQNRMAHASEILSQIACSHLRYVEAPVTIEYTPYSLAKGQGLGDSLMIVSDLLLGRLYR